MLRKNKQAQVMTIWIALKAKRNIIAHAEKTPDLRKIIKEAEELTTLQAIIVAFLAKEYNFHDSSFLKTVTSTVEKYSKDIKKFKIELENEFKNLEKILADLSTTKADIEVKIKEYKQQIQKLLTHRMSYTTLHKETSLVFNRYVEFIEHVQALNPIEVLNKQRASLDKILQELDELIKSIQKKVESSENTYQALEVIQKKQEPKVIEKASESNVSAKRKQGSTEEQEELKIAASPSKVEIEKKQKADEEESPPTPTLTRRGV